MNNLKLVFVASVFYLSFVGWGSNSWLVIWFIMEVMFLIFVGLSCSEVSYSSVEFLMKYFIIQVFVSLIFLSFMVFYIFNLGLCVNFLLLGILMMKLGMFPFHFWTIMVLGKLGWLTFLLLTTALKLLPILMIYYMNDIFSFNLVLILSALVASLFGIGNEIVQKVLGYSSLAHLCWLLMSLGLSIKMFVLYFFSYFIVTVILVLSFYYMNVFYVNQFKFFSGSEFMKFLVFFLILSLAGFPPFLGFILKWVVANMVSFYNLKLLVFFMVSFSLFSVIFYLELFFYVMMLNSVLPSWHKPALFSLSIFFFCVLFSLLVLYFFI